jgi:hypothetical protein
MTHEYRPDRDELPQRTPLEELLTTALLAAELAEAHLPHIVMAEIGPHREQVFIGPCDNGLEALMASIPLELELRREFPDQKVSVRVAPVHPMAARQHGLGSVVRPSGPASR